MSDMVSRIARTFAGSPLFARLSDGERWRLARRATRRTYSAGSIIIREGDTSMTLYVVLSGRVAIEVQSTRVRELAAGGFFGEMGLIDDRPRSASAIAVEDTECALLGAWDIRQHAGLALGLLPIFVERLRERVAGGSADTERDWLAALDGG